MGSKGSGWPSGSKNGSNRVGLTSKRVQIWVQPYNVLNKPDLKNGSGWAFKVQNRLSWVGLALRVKIRVKFGSGWSGSFGRTRSKLALNKLWNVFMNLSWKFRDLKMLCANRKDFNPLWCSVLNWMSCQYFNACCTL